MSSLPAQASMPYSEEVEPLLRTPLDGAISVPGMGRVALLSADVIRELHVAILDRFPETAPDVLYRSGFEWALQSMIPARTEQPAAASAREHGAPPARMLNWWEAFRRGGWGVLSRIEQLDSGTALVELQDGAVGAALGRSDDPVCHLYAGLFAGAFSFLRETECHGVEVQCRTLGAANCQFVLGPAASIDQIETWRQEGIAASEIVERIGTQWTAAATAVPAATATAVILRDEHGTPVVAASPEMLRSLNFVLQSEQRDGCATVLKAAGRSAGRRLAARHDASLAQSGRPLLGEQPLPVALRAIEYWFLEYGWGVLETDAPSAGGRTLIVGSLAGSPFAALGEDRGRPMDALPTGILQGFCEHVTGQTLASEEIACVAAGANECVFAVSTPERLAGVAPFLGRDSADRIIARLRS